MVLPHHQEVAVVPHDDRKDLVSRSNGQGEACGLLDGARAAHPGAVDVVAGATAIVLPDHQEVGAVPGQRWMGLVAGRDGDGEGGIEDHPRTGADPGAVDVVVRA